MSAATGRGGPPAGEPGPGAVPDLAAITRAASREAGGVPPDLLGDYLPAVLDAASTGRRLTSAELAGHGRSGEQAAESGVALRGLVDLYLSATWRLWRELATAAARVGAARAAGGRPRCERPGWPCCAPRTTPWPPPRRASSGRTCRSPAARRPSGSSSSMTCWAVAAAWPTWSPAVPGSGCGWPGGTRSCWPTVPPARATPVRRAWLVERLIASAVAPAPSLTMIRSGRLVAVIGVGGGSEADQAAEALARRAVRGRASQGRDPASRRWRVAIGRPYTGPAGVMRSYEEATDALDVAERLALADPVVHAGDLLMYRVILRDRAALADLVTSLLLPLNDARDGAGPLLETLEAYFASGQVAAQAARRLHLSVRAVTYRLARVKALTGKDPADPEEALGLQLAVIGARLLGWPDTPLDAA